MYPLVFCERRTYPLVFMLTERKTSVTRKKSTHACIASVPSVLSVLSVLSVYFVVINYSRGFLSIRGSKEL